MASAAHAIKAIPVTLTTWQAQEPHAREQHHEKERKKKENAILPQQHEAEEHEC